MVKYICHFKFAGKAREVVSPDGILAFNCGFWINSDGKRTNGGDRKYWIPPSQINHIERVDDNEK